MQHFEIPVGILDAMYFLETEGNLLGSGVASPSSVHGWKLPCLDDCAKTGYLKFHSRR